MTTVPVSLVAAAVLLFLLLHNRVRAGRFGWVTVLIALCASVEFLIFLSFSHSSTVARALHPVVSSFLPPAAWITFQSAVLRKTDWTDLRHLTGPVIAMALGLFAPRLFGVFLPLIFFIYSAMMVLRCIRAIDEFPLARFSLGNQPPRIWMSVAVLLILNAIFDLLIIYALGTGSLDLRRLIFDLFPVLSLGSIAVLSLLDASNATPPDDAGAVKKVPTSTVPLPKDHDIMDRLDLLMKEQRPYLDPDLSLQSLAISLNVPAKQLSRSVNQIAQKSVSRYINDARIKTAQAALINGEEIKRTLYLSGFNTRSNFYREFQRVTGVSPKEWLVEQAGFK